MSGNKVNEKKEKIEMLMIRGIRGAIEVKRNERDSILAAARCLLKNILSENQLEPEDIVSIIFTTTKDINAEFPAAVLRDIGWKYIPALCAHEMDVPGGMKGVIRILVHAYVNKNQKDIKHQYLDKTEMPAQLGCNAHVHKQSSIYSSSQHKQRKERRL